MVKKKKRIKNLENLGMHQGLIYKYTGSLRSIYKSKKNYTDYIGDKRKINKLCPSDYFIYFDSDVWLSYKANVVYKKNCLCKHLDAEKKLLEKKDYEIVEIFRAPNSDLIPTYDIKYKCKENKFSGRLYIGKGNSFGWINVEQMTNDDFSKYFQIQETG